MRIALVVGGSSGIGQAAAVELARRGAGVIVTYSGNPAGAKETVAAVEREGGTAVAFRLDVGRTEEFPAFRDQVAAALRETWQRDTFDYLVNSAGFGGMAMFTDVTEELFDRFLRVLLKGPYFLTQTLLPLLADGGAIVNVSSSSALPSGSADAGYTAYAAMKGGLNVWTRVLAKELAVRGIRVNAVSPGPTRTRLADADGVVGFEAHPEVIPMLAAQTALGRVGEPEDVGVAIAALLGDESRWITAQNIEVSGGFGL
ncbi:SDR family NAD(P)-dependent oxidoreductase [Paractinoplanes brasiliensis]|uniref:NAD(P)-dependent dehydrogenase (Short-subunit alcohol dehydrogenase family) n=1 Tax=Paractinoplanes brasiliensis TaxID=52695 RepID=A0A4R6JX15_9ACTN|nr:SDR family oxidoreductase [Actinoplanes brasiliensis]TDO39225.1 NAD(P)-dependent dehydrogenase (short-subunit alcohol dehydrogenase family) [Actinoplanes brasiliensis]GID30073.1 short-chain dehydrogenase [Actinoplanes brasiliensis]